MRSDQEKYIAFLTESIMINMIIDYLDVKNKPMSLDKIINHIIKYSGEIGSRLQKIGKVDARDYIIQLLQDRAIKQDENNNFLLTDEDELIQEVIDHFQQIEENEDTNLDLLNEDHEDDLLDENYSFQQPDLLFDDDDDSEERENNE